MGNSGRERGIKTTDASTPPPQHSFSPRQEVTFSTGRKKVLSPPILPYRTNMCKMYCLSHISVGGGNRIVKWYTQGEWGPIGPILVRGCKKPCCVISPDPHLAYFSMRIHIQDHCSSFQIPDPDSGFRVILHISRLG
jgi:hypothetical protein